MAFQWLTPELVGAVDLEVARDKRADRSVVLAVGGAGEAPSSPWVEVVLAHQPADLLGFDDMAAMAELGADAAVTVALEGLGDPPELRDDLRVRWLDLTCAIRRSIRATTSKRPASIRRIAGVRSLVSSASTRGRSRRKTPAPWRIATPYSRQKARPGLIRRVRLETS